MPGNDTVIALEESAFNAWPALDTIVLDGWIVRLAGGYTKRANSVNALCPRAPARDIVPAAARIFAREGLPLVFRLSPLADAEADADLARLGFAHLDETIVMTKPLADAPPPDPDVQLDQGPSPAWLDAHADANAVPDGRRILHERLLGAIRLPMACATLANGGIPVAWGLGVACNANVGLFDIVTAPDARRQGAGRRLVGSLMAWGRSQGATHAFLQVVAANAPAIALYEKLGFRAAYRYHYRMAPSA
ncbi:MAG: GNAT family N-acetyltransferase [Hyphomicrobiaceae bacterium]